MSKAVEITNIDIIHTVIANTVETTDDTDVSIVIDDVTPIISPMVLQRFSENIHTKHLITDGKNTTNIARITNTPAPVPRRFMLH